jgi:hypothetical protein
MYNFQPFVVPTTQNQEQPWAQAQSHWQALPPPPSSHPYIMHSGWNWPGQHWQLPGPGLAMQTMPGMPWCRTPNPYYFHAGLPFSGYADPSSHWQPVYYPSQGMHPSRYSGASGGRGPKSRSRSRVPQAESQHLLNHNTHVSPGTVYRNRSTGTHRGVGAGNKTGEDGKVWRTPSQRTH